jgi:DNA-binding beta-propeller fold protein YncE
MNAAAGATRSFGWTELELPEDGSKNWAHPGAAMGADGSLYVAGSSGHTIHRLRPGGEIDSVEVGTTECHGVAVNEAGGIWIADPGQKATLEDGKIARREAPGRAVYAAPDGGPGHDLADPGEGWKPTGVALHDFARGSDGRVWVADGYGVNLVHCFDADGALLWTSDGSASGLSFSTPHGIAIDTRGPEARVVVADRSNRRIVVLTVAGDFVETYGSDVLTSPSALAVAGDLLWVAELLGSLVALDRKGNVVQRVGSDLDPKEVPGWPNQVIESMVTAPDLSFGSFRAPHGLTVMPTGEVVIAEWIIGGRVTVLSPVPGGNR